MRQIPRRVWWLAVLSALLQVAMFPIAGPVPAWRRLFCWVCLMPLLMALTSLDRNGKQLSAKSAAWVGYVCGVLWYAGNCYWIYPTMHVYGGLAGPVAFGILILFCLYVGLYHALFGWVLGWIANRQSAKTALVVAPFAWVAVELARARITGFPWDLLGYTQVDNSLLTKIAPVAGVMGISLLIAAVNAAPLAVTSGRELRGSRLVWCGWLLAVVGLNGTRMLPTKAAVSGSHAAVLLQDNLSVGAEGAGGHGGRDDLLRSFGALSLQPEVKATNLRPGLILWPEAPADFRDPDPVYRSTVGQVAAAAQAPVIVDAIGIEPPAVAGGEFRIYNSASFFSPDGSYAGRYSKMHLVPFGEYVPYKDVFFFAGHLLDSVGQFTPGTRRNLFETGEHKVGVFICYESIFGDEMRELAESGADVMVNLSDDGWYGDSSAPWEHLDMVRMRAIENDRFVLRSTNTGVTAVIDPEGRVGATLPRHVRSSIAVSFDYVTGTTFYTRHGDWVAWICAAVTVGFVGVRRKIAVDWWRGVLALVAG